MQRTIIIEMITLYSISRLVNRWQHNETHRVLRFGIWVKVAGIGPVRLLFFRFLHWPDYKTVYITPNRAHVTCMGKKKADLQKLQLFEFRD